MAHRGKEKLIVNGKRLDGRALDEIRPITIKAGVIPQADGSAEVRIGETVAIAAVYGPKQVLPKHLKEDTRAYLKVIYDMASFSTSDRNRPGPSRRSREISKVMIDSLAPAIYLDKYPGTSIEVFIEIMNANAGTRTTAINAASVALADAGIEMKDLVASVAAGKISGKVAVDLFQPEDNFGEADVPVAMMPSTEEITLLQMDGDLSKDEFKEAMKMCKEAIKKIYEEQKKALVEKYKADKKAREVLE